MKKSIKNYIFVLLFLTFALNQAQSSVRTNFEILDSLVNKASESVTVHLLLLKQHSLALNIQNHPAGWLITQSMIKACAEKSISLMVADSSGIKPTLVMAVYDCSVTFANHPDDRDSLVRTCKLKISGTLYGGFKNDVLPEINYSFSDYVSRQDLPFIQSREHDFARSPVPEPQRTFFRDITEPFLIITSAALVVILLFTIRSN